MRSSIVFAIAILLPLAAAADDGWYTTDQASKGEILFNDHCAECHRPDLTGAMRSCRNGKISR
jgi:S-disulfanyl-L-cysteine oxidoreductase SoxD